MERGPEEPKTSGRKRYTSADKALAIQLYKDNIPEKDILARVGCSKPALYAWLEKAGVERRRRRPVDERDERITEIEHEQKELRGELAELKADIGLIRATLVLLAGKDTKELDST